MPELSTTVTREDVCLRCGHMRGQHVQVGERMGEPTYECVGQGKPRRRGGGSEPCPCTGFLNAPPIS
jgi:hypothetical protein